MLSNVHNAITSNENIDCVSSFQCKKARSGRASIYVPIQKYTRFVQAFDDIDK